MTNASTNKLSNGLAKNNDRAFQWKIHFNRDPSKQAYGAVFSRKPKKGFKNLES